MLFHMSWFRVLWRHSAIVKMRTIDTVSMVTVLCTHQCHTCSLTLSDLLFLQGSGIHCRVCLDRGSFWGVKLPVSGIGSSLNTSGGEEQPLWSKNMIKGRLHRAQIMRGLSYCVSQASLSTFVTKNTRNWEVFKTKSFILVDSFGCWKVQGLMGSYGHTQARTSRCFSS